VEPVSWKYSAKIKLWKKNNVEAFYKYKNKRIRYRQAIGSLFDGNPVTSEYNKAYMFNKHYFLWEPNIVNKQSSRDAREWLFTFPLPPIPCNRFPFLSIPIPEHYIDAA